MKRAGVKNHTTVLTRVPAMMAIVVSYVLSASSTVDVHETEMTHTTSASKARTNTASMLGSPAGASWSSGCSTHWQNDRSRRVRMSAARTPAGGVGS